MPPAPHPGQACSPGALSSPDPEDPRRRWRTGSTIRAIADAHEVIAEFKVRRRTYRLILPQGHSTFSVERLVRDEWHRWIGRWTPYGVGCYHDTTVISTVRGRGQRFPVPIEANIALALRYVRHGPLSGTRIRNA